MGKAKLKEQSLNFSRHNLRRPQKVSKQNSTSFQESGAVGFLYLVEIRIPITSRKKKQTLTFVWDNGCWKALTHSFYSGSLYDYNCYKNSVRLGWMTPLDLLNRTLREIQEYFFETEHRPVSAGVFKEPCTTDEVHRKYLSYWIKSRFSKKWAAQVNTSRNTGS